MTSTPNNNSSEATARMPTWYLPHGGGPCFFMEWNPPDTWNSMELFLRGIAATLPQHPKAIVVVSAHWLAPDFRVTSGTKPDLIYDYYGFPPHTYQLHYPAQGEPKLAQRIADLLGQAQLPAETDARHGFDHGMFIPLMLVFPDADIPVVQLSLHAGMDPQKHLDAGKALQPLRDEGVLIVGSGMSFHNLPASRDPRFSPISEEFDRWLTAVVENDPAEREKALTSWTKAPSARLCHPTGGEEHLLPLMVAAGAAGKDLGQCVFSERVIAPVISAYSFG